MKYFQKKDRLKIRRIHGNEKSSESKTIRKAISKLQKLLQKYTSKDLKHPLAWRFLPYASRLGVDSNG